MRRTSRVGSSLAKKSQLDGGNVSSITYIKSYICVFYLPNKKGEPGNDVWYLKCKSAILDGE